MCLRSCSLLCPAHPQLRPPPPGQFRGYALQDEPEICDTLGKSLAILKVRSLFCLLPAFCRIAYTTSHALLPPTRNHPRRQAKRMIMGHTVQEGGRITTRCGGRIVLIDIGISAIYGRNVGALEIRGDALTALYRGGRRERL